jgi:hypothetical protein
MCLVFGYAVLPQHVAHGVSPMPAGLGNAFYAFGCGRSVDVVLHVTNDQNWPSEVSQVFIFNDYNRHVEVRHERLFDEQ